MGERVGDDAEPRDTSTDVLLKQDDGFYGIDSGDIQEHVESGWLNPSANNSEIRLWVGSFNEKQPAIQWLNGKTSHDAVFAVELTYQHLSPVDIDRPVKKQKGPSPASPVWNSLAVDARSNALLDRDSTEMLQLLSAKKEQKSSHVDFLNNNTDSTINGRSPTATSDAWFHKLACYSLIKGKKADLGALIETKTYSKGQVILSYGEHKRDVFYVQKGKVDLLGPASSIGTNTIGSIAKGTYFNEMALFGAWSTKPATFQAADNVTCEVLSFDALMESFGEEKIEHVRSELIQKRYTAMVTPPTPTSSGGSKSPRRLHRRGSSGGRAEDTQLAHVSDATHAQTFTVKIPSSALSSTAEALSYRLEMNVFDCLLDEKTNKYSKHQFLGHASVLPSQFNAHGEGSCTLPIFSSNEADGFKVVGQIAVSYLLVHPFAHPANNLALSWRSYWRERPPLNVGHRGMGRSYHQVDGFRHALTRENTLASFILAGRSGADFVEFDVQLTKDRVPVLYHDFVLNAGLEDKRAWAFGTKAEEYQIGIHEMSLRQLRRCQLSPVPRKKVETALSQLVKKHRSQLLAKKSSIGSTPLPENTDDDDEEHLVDFYPQLEELLKHVPAEVGLNVEIKYPEPVGNRVDMRKLPAFAMNGYVDGILKCVFDHAGSRRVFFSCFDPNVCVMLRAKQTRYPVFFLTYGAIQPQLFDARLSLQFAVNFVKMERLQGIVSNCPAFLAEPELVQVVKDQIQRPLLTWGDQNTNHESVQLQKRHAIDGVISDNIGDFIRQDKKLMKQ